MFEAVVERFAERERANWESIAASVNPRTPAELAEAIGAFARDETGPQRTLALTRFALLVEVLSTRLCDVRWRWAARG